MVLETAIEKIPRISFAYQKKLKKLGIKTLRDLLFYFPRRYEDFSVITPIVEAKLNKMVCIKGKILKIKSRRTPVKKIILTEALIQDETGAIRAIWFNQPYLLKTLKEKNEVFLAGKVLLGDKGVYLSNPSYEKISSRAAAQSSKLALIHTARLVPVYPETEGLSSRWLRYILRPLLIKLADKIPESLPLEIIKKEKLLPIQKAIWQIHFPDSKKLAQKARARFSFEELFLIELFVLREKMKMGKSKGISIPLNLAAVKKLVHSLPFKLTNAQRKCSWQILKDLQKPTPMSRLLQGDVGSGKTVVATIAALNTIEAGFKVALMAPTEILAKQHFEKISQMLKLFNSEIGLLTSKEGKISFKGKTSRITKEKILEKLKKSKGANFLIGTHALIQKRVKINKLALVILDEQHRFGVKQRAKLVAAQTNSEEKNKSKPKAKVPHLLSMTATPIPRTLALTIYGDLDLSSIDELPKGRKKIITRIVPPEERKKAYEFIKKQIKKGRQAFVICPRIEPGAKEESGAEQARFSPIRTKITRWTDVKAVKEEYQKLAKEIFPDLKVEMLHGRMKAEKKEKIMKDFEDQKIDILVSTSVVEVGVDVPNASVIVIEGAEKFGLAQLHQFRGRVGRAKHQSYCFLFTDSNIPKTQQRLKALIDCENGFELAEKDLQIRGPGDFFGKKQWGIPDLAMSALKNLALVEKTRERASEILKKDPELKNYPLLRKKLKKFKGKIHLE